MNYNKVKESQKKYVMPTYAPELLLVKGEGACVWDESGKRYLDFASGISVCNLGHCHPAVTQAITEQAGKLVHVSNIYMNENQPLLARKLINHGFDGVVFFSNSGAEANEGLIKFARKWGSDRNKSEIIVMNDSFHGRTLATLAATGRSKYREGFAPDMPGFKFVPFNDFGAVANAVDDKTVAVFLEPVQGEGGIIPAEKEYLLKLRKFCDEKGILLMFDEVQCGMGRTGTFYAWQGYGVEPDALSLAKALGNGYPIGAFIVKRKYSETLTSGTHASTFGGTPLACAVARAVIDTFDNDKILENCRDKGKILKRELELVNSDFDFVKEVRSRGLMVGIALDRPASKFLGQLREEGLIALSAGENVLRLLPPLNITEEQVNTAVDLIRKVFKANKES